ncbi:hypothetical protein STEG23_006000 [Scotinomys teguina]
MRDSSIKGSCLLLSTTVGYPVCPGNSVLLGTQAALCTVTISPRCGLLGPSEERQLNLELTANTLEKLTELALPCHVSGMEKPLALGISGKPLGLRVTVAVSAEDSDGRRQEADWCGRASVVTDRYSLESMLSHRKGAAFVPHISQGMLRAYQQLRIDITGCANMWGEYWDDLLCMDCKECRGRNVRSQAREKNENSEQYSERTEHDIRLDWETYVPEESEDKLLELLVFYGPPFPLRDPVGNELVCPETSEGSSQQSPSPSNASVSSHAAPSSGNCSGGTRTEEQIISVILQGYEGVPSNMYHISPKQVVIPAGGNSTIYISFTPMVLGLDVLHKVECTGYALGFMSLDKETDRQIPGRMRRLQDFAVGPLRLDLNGHIRHAQLSAELDSSGYLEFRCQASDLIWKNPCCGVLSNWTTTRHLKLINTTEILHSFRVLVSKPFFISQGGASWDNRACHQQCEEEIAFSGQQLILRPQENMLVDVSFSLSLELLSYQKLPADQMLPRVDIQQNKKGEKQMVFTENLLLGFTNQTIQEIPLRAVVAVPALQLSTSWVDFGTCFVNQQHTREVYLMNLSDCLSYWTVLMGQEEPAREDATFGVSPGSGLLEARPTNAPPVSIPLQVFFNPRSCLLYQSTMVVEGMLSEKPCTLRLRGRGSLDERYVIPNEF